MPGPGSTAAALALLGASASLVMAPCGPGVADAVQAMGRTDYASGFALLNLAYAVGMVAGPILGSALVEAWGIRAAFMILAAGYAIYGFTLRSRAN
jgi:MFS family permease